MPERLSALGGAGRVPVVAVEGDDVVLVEPRAAAGPDGRVALQTLDAARRRAAVVAMLERAGEVRDHARLCLASNVAMVRGVTLRDDLSAGAAALELMPSEQRGPRESGNERTLRWAMVGVVLLLFLEVLALPIVRKLEAAIALLP